MAFGLRVGGSDKHPGFTTLGLLAKVCVEVRVDPQRSSS